MLRVFLLRVPTYKYVFYAHKNDFVAPENNQSDRISSFLTKMQSFAFSKLREKKEEIDSAPIGVGMKGKMRKVFQMLESHVHPSEATLMQMQKASVLEVITISDNHNDLHVEALKRRSHRIMRVLLKRHEAYHLKWTIGNVMVLPFTLLASFLPGPNIFLAWNIYRLYCNVQAFRAANIFLNKDSNRQIKYAVWDAVYNQNNNNNDQSQTQIARQEQSKFTQNYTTEIPPQVDANQIPEEKNHATNFGEDIPISCLPLPDLPGLVEFLQKMDLFYKNKGVG